MPLKPWERFAIGFAALMLVITGVRVCSGGLAGQEHPQPVESIRLIDPWTDAPVDAGPNPVRLRGELVLFRVDGMDGDVRIYLNHETKFERLPPNQQGWLSFGVAPPDGEHLIEVETIGLCPPASIQPWGCSRWFAFTLYDGVVTPAPLPPTGLRIVDG